MQFDGHSMQFSGQPMWLTKLLEFILENFLYFSFCIIFAVWRTPYFVKFSSHHMKFGDHPTRFGGYIMNLGSHPMKFGGNPLKFFGYFM